MPAARIDTIARSFFTYVSTDAHVRSELIAAGGDNTATAKVINGVVSSGAPLTADEVPAVRAQLQTLASGTAKALTDPFETEILQAIGVHGGPRPA